MPAFTGQLRSNEIYAAIYNMIISQEVFADNIDDTKASLVDAARVDGGLYGDQKLYYATDVLHSKPWGGDAEATNLLAINRGKDPECQAIILDVFRQITLTTDSYLSKRAWSTPGAFASFNSTMLSWIRDTKAIYDSTLYNCYIGTSESNIGKQKIEVVFPREPGADATYPEVEAWNRLCAQAIAQNMADLMVEISDVSRDYNDYEFLRSFESKKLIAVWNSEAINKINKLDIPMIFHELKIDKKGEYILPARYFGTINTTGGTVPASNISIRSLYEMDYVVSGKTYSLFPGDLLPAGATYNANETYTQDNSILFKIMHKRSVPYMSAFEVGTSFYNPKSLTENNYLTWGHNELEYLKNYPFITVRRKIAE